MKRIPLISVFACLLMILSACGETFQSKADYFNGIVLVEYFQTTESKNDDSITFTFNEKGDYEVSFSYTQGTEHNSFNQGEHTLPKDFVISITDGPRTKVITQYLLPGFLTITISYQGQTESHDFK